MRAQRSGSSGADRIRDDRIADVINDVLRRRGEGEPVDTEDVRRQHADLMPELDERLRMADEIENAARRAKQPPPKRENGEPETAFAESRRFLRQALTDYEILDRIHYGGQGIVYKALQRTTRRLVAIKVLLDGPLASERQRHRFEREVELISRLQHPSIVTLYESGVVRGRHYFAMEFVEGLSVDDYVLVEDLSIREVVQLFVRICNAVSYAHQRGVIHRDLNPANVIVDLAGVPHVLDFGLAKDAWASNAEQSDSVLTAPGQCVGTLPYLSPEQAGGLDAQIDVRSDVYTLGVMLFRLLSNMFPYPVVGDAALVRRHIIASEPMRLRRAIALSMSEQPREASTANRDLEAILVKALAKEKEHRYQSVAEFRDDLECYLAGDTVEARADNRFYLLHRTFRKYRAFAAVALLFVLLLGASSITVTMLWFQARTQRENARQIARVAHSALDDVVTEIDEAIRPLAGGVAVRDRLLDGVADNLARLRPLVESDDAMEDLLAALREKQGDMAYAQGRLHEAAEHYHAYLDASLRRSRLNPSSDEPLPAVLRAHRKLASVSSDARSHFEAAIRIGNLLVKRHPDDQEARHALCDCHVEFGRFAYLAADYELAAQHIDAAVALAAPMAAANTGDDRWALLLARAHEWDGDIQIKLGRGGRGVESLAESLRLRRTLSEARPADVERRRDVLLSCIKLGSALRENGQSARAREVFIEGVAEGEYLTRADPTVTLWKRDLYSAHDRLARWYLFEGDPDAAQMHCDAAVSLAEELVRVDPRNADDLDVLAFSHVLRGRVHMARGELEQAFEEFKHAVAVWEDLSAAAPDNLALRARVAVAYNWSGWCARELGQFDQALQHYRCAHEIRRALHDIQPLVPQRTLDLILSRMKLAVGHLELDTPADDEAAAALLTEAENDLEDFLATGKLVGREQLYELWIDAINKNKKLIADRAATPGSTPHRPSIEFAPVGVPEP